MEDAHDARSSKYPKSKLGYHPAGQAPVLNVNTNLALKMACPKSPLMLLDNNTASSECAAGAPEGSNSNNQFSHANVFGLFLILSLCLLVQPYGSLLYTKPRTTAGRFIFFFWRLNPLACALEAILVAIALADGLRDALPSSGQFTSRFQLTLAAMQMLRRTELRNGNGTSESSFDDPLSSPATSRGSRDSTHGIFCPELVIEVLSTVAVLVVLIKLASVDFPLHLRLPAWLMVTDWIAIQVVGLMAPGHPEDIKYDSAEVVRRAVNLAGKLNNAVVWDVFSLVLLPLFIYLTPFAMLKAASLPKSFRAMLYPVFGAALSTLEEPAFLSCLVGRDTARDPSCLDLLLRMMILRSQGPVKTDIGSTPIGLGLLCAMMVLCVGLGVLLSVSNAFYMSDPVELFSWGWVILPCFVYPALWALNFVPTVAFTGRSKKREWLQCVYLLFNLLAVAFFFAAAMLLYDAEDTSKPDWLDWLG